MSFSPLMFHALRASDARLLSIWASSLDLRETQRHVLTKNFEIEDARRWLDADQIDAIRASKEWSPRALDVARAAALSLVGEAIFDADVLGDAKSESIAKLSRLRESHAAFKSNTQKVIDIHPSVFALTRGDDDERVVCLHNVSNLVQLVQVSWRQLLGATNVRDLVRGVRLAVHGPSFELDPYDVRWFGR
jgi:glycosidase